MKGNPIVIDDVLYGKMDNGKWYVRPISWAGKWDRDGILDHTYKILKDFDFESECLSYIGSHVVY